MFKVGSSYVVIVVVWLFLVTLPPLKVRNKPTQHLGGGITSALLQANSKYGCVRWVKLTSCRPFINLVAAIELVSPNWPPHPRLPPDCFLLRLSETSVSNHLPFKPTTGPLYGNWLHLSVIFPIGPQCWFWIRAIVCFPSDANHLFVEKFPVPRTCQETLCV